METRTRVSNGENLNKRLPFQQQLDSILEKFLRGLLPEERRYLVLVPVVGVLAGAVAFCLEELLYFVELTCWGEAARTEEGEVSVLQGAENYLTEYFWLVVLIPTLGGALVALTVLLLKKKQRFGGTASIMEALAFKKGRIPLVSTLLEGVVSIGAVGMGASLGREGALVHSGSALSSWLGTRFRLADHHVKILLACGAAGGMAAAYNAPIGATMFAMEILVGSFALELFGPMIVCSVLSTTVYKMLLPETAEVYTIHPVVLGELGIVELELVLDLILGAFLGLVAVVFIRVFSGLNVLFGWLGPVAYWKPILAMLVLGLVGLAFPQLFGNGYDTVNEVINGRHGFSIQLLLLLPLLKILVTALCRASGVPGGLFTPSLFVGALLGCAYGIGVAGILPPDSVSNPGIFALVGMGAILSGTLQAPITAILMIFELTQSYEFILRLMIACSASALVSHLLQSGSLYTASLKQRGIFLPTASTPAWIRQPEVSTVLTTQVTTVSPSERFENLTRTFLKAPEGQDHLFVVNEDRVCLGVISLHDIKRFIHEAHNLEMVIAADIMNPSFPHVYAGDPVSKAIELLGEQSFELLPVLDGPEARRLLGTVSKRKLLVAYSEANLARQKAKETVDGKAALRIRSTPEDENAERDGVESGEP